MSLSSMASPFALALLVSFALALAIGRPLIGYLASWTLGQIIREDLYMAVAAILAFVFNLDQALASGQAQPEVEVPAGMRFDAVGLPEA